MAATAVCGVLLAGWQSSARATINVDGTLDPAYGPALAVQTNNTGFGDNADTTGTSTGGSELDAAYGVVQGGNLNLFFAGNVETNFNHLQIFIADGRGGQNTLNAQAGSTLAAANGAKFSPGFNATLALDVNGGGQNPNTNPPTPITEYVDSYDLTAAGAGASSYQGNFLPGDGNSHALFNGISISANLTNTAGVSGDTSVPANQSSAAAVTTGFELSIPLALLGSPTGGIQVLADVSGGSDNFLSNQFLPGLPSQQGNLGTGSQPNSLAGDGNAFDFSGTPNAFFTVPNVVAPAMVNGSWANPGSGSWGVAANWQNGLIPTNPGDTATFGPVITAPSTVTLDGGRTVGVLTFNSPVSYTVAQGTGGTLTIDDTGDAAGVNPTIAVQAGSHAITAPVALVAGVTITAATGTQLTLGGVVSGAGTVTLAGAGTVVMGGADTYTGPTAVNAGTLTLAAGGSLASPAITVAAGAKFNATGTLAPAATLTSNGATAFGANPGTGITSRTLAGLTIGAGGTVSVAGGGGATRTVLVTPAFAIAGTAAAPTGQLDLGGNDLIVQGGSLATVAGEVRAGVNFAGTPGTFFAGQGITSSLAATNAKHLTTVGVIQNVNAAGSAVYATFDGQAVTSADVLVRYTYFGDANLDGVVNAADYAAIDAGYLGKLSGWGNGDFNYDGKVDGSDYTLIDNAFNEQAGTLGSLSALAVPVTLAAAATNLIAAPTDLIASGGTAAVPEPTSMALVAAGACGLLARRRRARVA